MLLVGLTGGIGSGKTTVGRMLEARGAVVLDADRFARQAVEPGTPGYERVVERFGPKVLTPSGEIDRERLAGIVFHDPEARRELERIVHPDVARQFHDAVEPYRETSRIVVYTVPLLVEAGLRDAFDVVVAVTAPEEVRVARLAADRGMDEEDVRARIRSQVTDEDRERAAALVIRNDGTLEELESEVDRVWGELVRRAEGG